MLTKEQVKHHCNIEQDFTEDDAWIDTGIKAAERYVEKWTRRRLYEKADDPLYMADPDALLYGEDIEMAMLLLIGHWYENRETVSVGQAATDIPFTVEALLQPYKIYGI